MKSVLDTSIVIAADLAPLDGDLAISAVTLAELHFGVLVAKQQQTRAERLRRLLLLQRTFDALPIDEKVAASYGQLAAAVVEAGRRPRARSLDLFDCRYRACAFGPALHAQRRRLSRHRTTCRHRRRLTLLGRSGSKKTVATGGG